MMPSLGYSPDELISKPASIILSVETLQAIEAMDKAAMKRRTLLLTKQGEKVPVLMSISVMRNQTPSCEQIGKPHIELTQTRASVRTNFSVIGVFFSFYREYSNTGNYLCGAGCVPSQRNGRTKEGQNRGRNGSKGQEQLSCCHVS